MIQMKNSEIESHELLTAEQRQMCKVFRNASKTNGDEFTMHDFAKIALRATARNYDQASREDEIASASAATVRADRELRRAAILYVYEAMKATDMAIIKEWSEFDEMLRSLEYLAGDMP